MKVVVFYPHITDYGGIERNIVGLSMKVAERRLTPVLLCFYDRVKMSRFSKHLQVIELEDHWNPLVKSLRLQKWLNNHKAEITGLPIFFSGKAGFYAAVQQRRPYPYALHFTDPMSLLRGPRQTSAFKRLINRPRAFFAEWLIGQGVKKADVCLTMTHWNANELKGDYKRHFEVIYQGGVPPKIEVKDSKPCTSGTLRLFSICRITESKNLDWILLATKKIFEFDLTSGWFNRVEVTIAGNGPHLEKLKDITKTLGLTNHVFFPGFLNEDAVERAYSRADLFLVPAKQGYGLPVLEALYRQVPVVQNRESRISELLSDNPWVAVSEDDPASFTEAVINHIKKLRYNKPDVQMLENLKTENGWAEELGNRCNWW